MATFYVGTTTGDFATIQEAINSELVNSGDTIIVRGSEYTLTNEKIELNKAIHLQAEGSVTVDRMAIGTAAGDFSVTGFTFNPTKNGIGHADGIYQNGVQNFNLTVDNCTFDLTNVASGTTANGIFFSLNQNKIGLTVRNSTFTANADSEEGDQAIRAAYLNQLELSGNQISGFNSNHAVQLSMNPKNGEDPTAVITGNTFSDCGYCGIYLGDVHYNNSDLTISNNSFNNMQQQGVSAGWGAVRIVKSSWENITITDNIVDGAHIGFNLNNVTVQENGSVDISGNLLSLANRPDSSVSAAGFTGLENSGIVNNTILIDDPEGITEVTGTAQLVVNDAWDALADGSKVPFSGKIYTIGVNAFSSTEAALDVVEDGGQITLAGSGTAEGKTELSFGKGIEFTLTGNAPDYALPIITLKNENQDGSRTIMNITDADIKAAELDARQASTINVTGSKVDDFGGNSIIKSYYDGIINVQDSSAEAMQVTTTGRINVQENGSILDTWQTNIMGNGILTIHAGGTFTTSQLNVGQTYKSGERDNTDSDRIGQAATVWVDGGTLETLATDHAYYYNAKTATIGYGNENGGLLKITNEGIANLNHKNGVTVGTDGVIEMVNGTLLVGKTLTNSGTITLDSGSFLQAADYTGSGSLVITVDAETFSGYTKVIDLNRTEINTADDEISFADAEGNSVSLSQLTENNIRVLFGNDGDVALLKQTDDSLMVNSEWSAIEDGEMIGGSDAVVKGVNAFGNMASAISAAIENGGGKITSYNGSSIDKYTTGTVIKFDGASGMEFTITGETSGDDSVAIEMRNKGNTDAEENFTVVDGKIAVLNIEDANLAAYKLAAYQNSRINVSDSVINMALYQEAAKPDKWMQNNVLYTKGNGELHLTGSTILNNTQLSAYGTLLKLDNSMLDGGSANRILGDMQLVNGSKWTLSNAAVTDGTGTLTIDGSEMVRKAFLSAGDRENQLVINRSSNGNLPDYRIHIGEAVGLAGGITGTGTMTVKNGAVFDFSKAYAEKAYADVADADFSEALVTVSEGSTLVLDGSEKAVTFNVDQLQTSGTVTISGEATVNISSLTGTITTEENATLTDSVLNGVNGYGNIEGTPAEDGNYQNFVLSVNGSNAGTINFSGVNTISNLDAGAGDTVNVDGSTLRFYSNGTTSDGFKVGNGAAWNLTDAVLEAQYAMSLDGNQSGEDAAATTFTAINSELRLAGGISGKGDGAGKHISQQIGNGDFDISFTDSTVEMGGKLILQSQNTAAIDLTFDNTAITFTASGSNKDALLNYAQNGTITFTGSNTVAAFGSAFSNAGTIEVLNGSSISVTANDMVYAANSNGSGNTGTLTVSNAEFTLNASGTKAFANTGSITLSNAVFTAAALDSSAEGASFLVGAGVDGTPDENKLIIGNFAGQITLKDEAVIVKGSSIQTSSNGTVFVEDDAQISWGTISGAALTVTEDLNIFDVVFNAEGSTQIFAGAISILQDFGSENADDELFINGFKVAASSATAGSVVIDGVLYDIAINAATGITATISETGYEPVSGNISIVQENGYTFAIDTTGVTGGAGDALNFVISSVTDGNGNALGFTADASNPLRFTLTEPAASGTLNAAVNVQDLYGADTQVTLSGTAEVADVTAPVLTLTKTPENGWNKSVQITASAADNFAGALNMEYTLDGGKNWLAYTAPFSVTANGKVSFRVTDAANNVAKADILVNTIDAAAPTLITLGDTATWKRAVQVSAAASDYQSGLRKFQYSLDSGKTWQDYSNHNAITMKQNGWVHFRAIDNLNNVTTKGVLVQNVDTAAPNMVVLGDRTTWGKTALVSAATSDYKSGIKSFQYSLDAGKTWQDYSNHTAIAMKQNGWVHFRATDNAGNVTTKGVLVQNVDTTAPVMQIFSNNNQVSAAASDYASGIRTFEYSLDGGENWQEYSNHKALTFTDDQNICFRAEDNAGNITEKRLDDYNNIDFNVLKNYDLFNSGASASDLTGKEMESDIMKGLLA